MFPVDNLAKRQDEARVAHLRHAARPHVLGPAATAYALWRKFYEARAALRDNNPAFAAKLLPVLVPVASRTSGLPLLPAGVRWEVDATPGTVTVTMDISGVARLEVVPPDGGAVLTPAVQTGATRQTFNFPALGDGLYRMSLFAAGTRVATVYVPVQRARFRDFRELSRALAFDFEPTQNPVASESYSEMLAVLYACDDAAATGQPDLFAELAQVADEIEKAATPIALYPRA